MKKTEPEQRKHKNGGRRVLTLNYSLLAGKWYETLQAAVWSVSCQAHGCCRARFRSSVATLVSGTWGNVVRNVGARKQIVDAELGGHHGWFCAGKSKREQREEINSEPGV